MTGHLEQSIEQLEHTAELPVLSEEAVLAQDEAARRAETDPVDRLDASVEALRAMLERAERRWTDLEHALRAQDRAIEALHERLTAAPASPAGSRSDAEAVPELMDVVAASGARAKNPTGSPEPVPAPADALEDEESRPERALLERIGYLEAYIAGRADRWRDMEAELEAKARRIAELEGELEQRIAREQTYEQRLHDEGIKADGLRSKLARMNRLALETDQSRARAPLDATQKIGGRREPLESSGADSPDFGGDAGPAESGVRPVLVCLTRDAPPRVVLDKQWTTIGRGPECDIRLLTHFVSRWHASIRFTGQESIIEDEHSTNGVYVNEEPVERRTLRDGDRITIGQSQFRFVCGDATE